MSSADPERRRRGWAIARYVIGWTGASLLVAVAVVVLLGGGASADDAELLQAADEGECVLRVDEGRPAPPTAELESPPTYGPPGPRPRPGVYGRPLPRGHLYGALRSGYVVVQYRDPLPPAVLERLAKLAEDLPERVVVMPDGTQMPYRLAATSWQRLMGCTSIGDEAVDALALFAERYQNETP